MPRCSKRQRSGAPSPAPSPHIPVSVPPPILESSHHNKRSRHSSSRRNPKSDESSFCKKRCLAWFRDYTTPSEPNLLGPEGMEKFCQDISVEPENVVMLVLAYKMGAKQMGYFTHEEWLKGLSDLQCDSVFKVRNNLENLRNLLDDPHLFKSIYRYAYDFARDKEQRSLDVSTGRAMLELLLGRTWPLHASFSQFLEGSGYRVINRDQWCNILEFSRTVNLKLDNYDADGAWPVMLDEFVEWYRQDREHNIEINYDGER